MALEDHKDYYSGYHEELHTLFIGEVINDVDYKDGKQHEQQSRREIISVFVDNLQRNKGAFYNVIEKEKEDTETDQWIFP